MLTNGHNNSYVVGTNDEFINEHQRNEEVSFYEGIGFSTHIYDGNHDIDAIALNRNMFHIAIAKGSQREVEASLNAMRNEVRAELETVNAKMKALQTATTNPLGR